MPRRKHDDIIIRKTYPFTLDPKAEGERIITGDANVYGILDSVGDIVEPGAFRNSLAADDVRHLLWQHDTYEVIGDGVFAETDTALRLVEGNLYEGVQRAEEAYAICKQARRPLGLSIGFAITKDGQYVDDENVRHITDAKLYEVSLVTFPANGESMVDGVKAIGFREALESAEDERDLWERRWQMNDAFMAALKSVQTDDMLDTPAKLQAADDIVSAYAEALAGWAHEVVLVPVDTDYLSDMLDIEAKAIAEMFVGLTPDEPASMPTVEADEAARALQSAMLAAALL
jgi:HK97 family phage prohead protease